MYYNGISTNEMSLQTSRQLRKFYALRPPGHWRVVRMGGWKVFETINVYYITINCSGVRGDDDESLRTAAHDTHDIIIPEHNEITTDHARGVCGVHKNDMRAGGPFVYWREGGVTYARRLYWIWISPSDVRVSIRAHYRSYYAGEQCAERPVSVGRRPVVIDEPSLKKNYF